MARIVRKRLADGTIREYVYGAKPAATASVNPRYAEGSLAALLHAYELSSDYRDLSAKSKAMLRIYLRPLTKWHDTPAHELERDVLMGAADAINVARGPAAANAFLSATSTVFGWAIERGVFKHAHPLWKAKRFRTKNLPTFKRELYDQAVVQLPEPLRRVLVLASLTGQRRGDLVRLTWANYDGARLRFTQQKCKHDEEPRQMDLRVVPELRAELDAWKAEAQGSNVVSLADKREGIDTLAARTILTNSFGEPWVDTALSNGMRKALEKIGLRQPGQRGVNIHGLRKLVAVTMAEAAMSPHQIMSVTGHRTIAMVQLYSKEADMTKIGDAAIDALSTQKKG